MYNAVIASPIGKLGIETEFNQLMAIHFLSDSSRLTSSNDNFTATVVEQLNNYFKDAHFQFTLSLHISGTDFQKRAWQALQKIALGTTLTYGELARKINSSPRGIGVACRTNRIPIIIPCHRIIAASNLGGFGGTVSGKWLEMKKWLLKHENAIS